MKLVTAIIKPFKLDEVREALSAIGKEAVGLHLGAEQRQPVQAVEQGAIPTGQLVVRGQLGRLQGAQLHAGSNPA